MVRDKYQIDMCHGPLLGKIILFGMPLLATYILQLLFNAADLVVIGHYADHNAMAAIGATMSFHSLVLNVSGGLAVGVNVVAAQAFGKKDADVMARTTGCSMLIAIVFGILMTVIGILLAKPMLVLMKTPDAILHLSLTYLFICFTAIPFISIYNFGCSILRAAGDTRRPFYYLIAAGIINVLLNLLFVIVFNMGVAGVALATALSHALAAFLVFRTLIQIDAPYGFRRKYMKLYKDIFCELLRIGIPAGVQSSCFSASNMLIQSSVNSFGSFAIAGNTAVLSMEGIVYMGSYTFLQAATAFTAQNYGGQKFKRIIRSTLWCMLCAAVCCTVLGMGFFLAGRSAISIFNPNPEVVRWGMIRMKILFTTYAMCGLMDAVSGAVRGLGYSLSSTLVCLAGACFFRVWWVLCIFPYNRTMEFLMISYPISWTLVTLVNGMLLIVAYRRILSSKCRIATPWLWLKPGLPRGYRYYGNSK